MKKKFVSVLLTAALTVMVSSTAFAADTPAAIATYDFAGGVPAGMTLVGGELANDDARGQVLSLTGGETGSSYASIDFTLFKDNDFSQGMTISMWVKANDGIPGSSPLYSFDIADTGYIATVATLEPAINTTANKDTGYPLVWVDPAKVNESPAQAVPAGEWHNVTVSTSAESIVIYLDGEVFSEPALGYSSAKFSVLLEQLQYITGLKLGSWDCTWWMYGDYAGLMDDVNVYNTALTQDQVKAVMATGSTTDAAAETTAAEATTEATEVPKTGVVSYAIVYGIGAVMFGSGSVLLKRKKESK